MIFNTRGENPSQIEEFEESDCDPLGPAATVRQQLSKLLPEIDWSDPTWGVYEGDGFSIEFNVGDDDPIDDMMLHVRGGGDAIAAIVSFARPLGWSALDCSMGDFLDLENPSQGGWGGFQEFRDRAIGQDPDDHGDDEAPPRHPTSEGKLLSRLLRRLGALRWPWSSASR
jgi:hypothetical protein